MKSNLLFISFFLAAGPVALAPFNISVARADDDQTTQAADLDADDNKSVDNTEQARWAEQVKAKYSLTDEQMKSLTDAGLQGPQMAKAAGLAQASGQPLDKVIQMRTTDKMGWGKIAKTLDVHPSTIGKSVAGLRHEINAEHKADKAARKAEKRAEREQRKAEKKAQKEERRQAQKERKAQRREEKAQNKASGQ